MLFCADSEQYKTITKKDEHDEVVTFSTFATTPSTSSLSPPFHHAVNESLGSNIQVFTFDTWQIPGNSPSFLMQTIRFDHTADAIKQVLMLQVHSQHKADTGRYSLFDILYC